MRCHRFAGRERAFTLIEILVVMAIAASMLGLMIIKIEPSDARRLESTGESLIRSLEMARDDAVARGRALAFSSDGQGFQFWMADAANTGWLALADTRTLVSGQFAPGIHLRSIQINGKPRPLGEKLVFSISGIPETFILTLAAGESTLRIHGDALGRLEVARAQ